MSTLRLPRPKGHGLLRVDPEWALPGLPSKMGLATAEGSIFNILFPCPPPVFFFSSQMAWANPSLRLHEARLQMNDVTNLPQPRDSCLLWERIYLTQKWYWPMKPFRRVRLGRVVPASQIDQDTGRQVEKALERQPLRPIRLMSPKPFSRLDFRCQRGLPLTFNHDRILKFWKLACLCHCNFFTPRSLKN
jgi:hypothetical protein